MGIYDEALKLLDSVDKTDYIEAKILKSHIFDRQGKYLEAFEEVNEAFFLAYREQNIILKFNSNSWMGHLLLHFGRYNQALHTLNNSLEIYDVMNHDEKMASIEIYARLLYTKGSIYHRRGQFHKSMENLMESLQIYHLLDIKIEIAKIYAKIAKIYIESGEIDLAIDYAEDSYEMRLEIGNDQDIAKSLNILGVAYQIKQDIEVAKEFLHTGLNINQQVGNNLLISTSLFNLILLYIEIGEIDTAKKYSKQFAELSENSGIIEIEIRYLLSKAIILKSIDRMISRAKSQEILKSLLNRDISHHNLMVLILTNLAQILLEELQLYGSQEIQEELKTIIQNLKFHSQEQQSYSLLIETLVIQSKIALVNSNLDLAYNLLNQAFILADEKGMEYYTTKVNKIIDKLNKKINYWKQLFEENASLKRRVEETNISDYLKEVSNVHLD